MRRSRSRLGLATALTWCLTSVASANLMVQYDFEGGPVDDWSGVPVPNRAGSDANGMCIYGAAYTTDACVGSGAIATHTGGVSIESVPLGSQFSIAGWVKFSNVSFAQCHTLFANCASGSTANGLAIFVNSYQASESATQGNRRIRIYTGNGSSYDLAETADGAFPADGLYHHLCFTIDRDGGTARIYLDGTDITVDNTILRTFQTMAPAYIGLQSDGFYPAEATVDDFRIYDQVLTAPQVASLVPEPAMLAVGGIVLGGLLVRRRQGLGC